MSVAAPATTAMHEPDESPMCRRLGHAWNYPTKHFRHCTRLGCITEQRTYGYDTNEGRCWWVDVNARIVTLVTWPRLIPTYPEHETVRGNFPAPK